MFYTKWFIQNCCSFLIPICIDFYSVFKEKAEFNAFKLKSNIISKHKQCHWKRVDLWGGYLMFIMVYCMVIGMNHVTAGVTEIYLRIVCIKSEN